MKLSEGEWYFIVLAIIIVVLISTNELEFGILGFGPLIYIVYRLIEKTLEKK